MKTITIDGAPLNKLESMILLHALTSYRDNAFMKAALRKAKDETRVAKGYNEAGTLAAGIVQKIE